jgi:U3 small nucleolar RNA-associated protein 25
MSDMQKELLAHMVAYRDVSLPLRTNENAAQIRELYCLHALNHVLKTRTKVLKNNERLREAAKATDARDIGCVCGPAL